MSLLAKGTLKKMSASLDGAVTYRLPVGEEFVELNPLIGKTINLTHTGNIFVVRVVRKPRKATLKATALCA